MMSHRESPSRLRLDGGMRVTAQVVSPGSGLLLSEVVSPHGWMDPRVEQHQFVLDVNVLRFCARFVSEIYLTNWNRGRLNFPECSSLTAVMAGPDWYEDGIIGVRCPASHHVLQGLKWLCVENVDVKHKNSIGNQTNVFSRRSVLLLPLPTGPA